MEPLIQKYKSKLGEKIMLKKLVNGVLEKAAPFPAIFLEKYS